MKAIVAALDFSPVTDLVVTEAAGLARAMGAKVVLLTVLVEPVFQKPFASPPARIAKITVDHERAVRDRLTELQTRLHAACLHAEVVVRRGDPAFHIVDAADACDASFIVIGSHGHTALYEVMLGSTTQTVVKRAAGPVLIVPAHMRPRPSLRPSARPDRAVQTMRE
jgi:nucleotide-binding universal stress UspA family protein